jgi:hypothetical protein
MAEHSPDDDRIYTHLLTLLSVSAGMVGVCLTAIGLVNVTKALRELEVWVDDFLAVSTVLFSFITLLSFIGMRTPIRRRWRHYMLMLDVLFCVGILTLVVASLILSLFMI